MSWTDLRFPAALAALALLGGCADRLAGDIRGNHDFGVALNANLDLMIGRPATPEQIGRLSDAFRVAAPDTVNFDFDRAAIDPEADAALRAQAAWLRATPGALVRIEGHADLVGGEAYNDRLGLRRARAVAARLAALGVAPARLRTLESRGARDPLVPVAEPERRNRRVLTVVEGWSGGVDGPGFDGKRALLNYNAYTTREAEDVVLETVDE